MACVYIIHSEKTNKFYVGSSREEDPVARLVAHNSGKTKSTKSGKMWELVHFENFDNYTDARKRENFLKSGFGRKWIYENFRNLKGCIVPEQSGGVA